MVGVVSVGSSRLCRPGFHGISCWGVVKVAGARVPRSAPISSYLPRRLPEEATAQPR